MSSHAYASIFRRYNSAIKMVGTVLWCIHSLEVARSKFSSMYKFHWKIYVKQNILKCWSHVYSSESASPDASSTSQSTYSCKVFFGCSESRNSAGPVLSNHGATWPSSSRCWRSRRLRYLDRCWRNSACRSNAGGLKEQHTFN